ncbi:MAG: UDP-N-acetylglucosamine 2-epimerase [Clostridia bacterium]|nr:UDP-N-acetylglucosamine 2-epimerase [Clostridia bacterium]
MNNNILIFYGSYGGGHLSAAKSITNYINKNYLNCNVTMVDCIEYINKYINKVSTSAYKEMAKKAPWAWKKFYQDSRSGALAKISTASNKAMSHKLFDLISKVEPDLIISTHPFSSQMCGYLKQKGKINMPIATILTDYKIHEQWLEFSEYMDYFFVSNEKMKDDMITKGLNKEKIFVTGIPVSERFLYNYNRIDICKEFDLNPENDVILFFAGGEFGLGRNTTILMLKALIRLFSKLQVVAISGKNSKMNTKFKKIVADTESTNRVKILEFTDKIPELMSIAKFVITKPGGLTITESFASHLPILIINPIPGQEEENAEFVEEKGAGIWIRKNSNIARHLKTLYRNPEILIKMKEKSKELAKPNSTEEICKILNFTSPF